MCNRGNKLLFWELWEADWRLRGFNEYLNYDPESQRSWNVMDAEREEEEVNTISYPWLPTSGFLTLRPDRDVKRSGKNNEVD